jgi:hypothetical protein
MNFGPDGRIHQKGEIVVFCDTGPRSDHAKFLGNVSGRMAFANSGNL